MSLADTLAQQAIAEDQETPANYSLAPPDISPIDAPSPTSPTGLSAAMRAPTLSGAMQAIYGAPPQLGRSAVPYYDASAGAANPTALGWGTPSQLPVPANAIGAPPANAPLPPPANAIGSPAPPMPAAASAAGPSGIPAGPPVAPAGAPNPFAAGGASGIQTIRTPATTVSTVSPEVRAGLGESNQAQQQAIAGQMGAESNAAEAQAATEDAKAQALRDEAASQGAAGDKTIARADDRAAAATKERGLLDQAHADLAGQKIDPNRWWNSQSTGQKVALGLAAAFSGFSAGIHGGANQALELVQKHIADDVAAQQENFDRQKGAVTAKDQAFQYFYDKVGGDKEAAARLATSFGLEQAAKVAAAHVQETASPSAKAAGAKVIALLQEKAAEVQRQGAVDLEKTQRFTPAGTAQVATIGGQPVAMTPAVRGADAAWQAKNAARTQALDRVEGRLKALKPGEGLAGIWDRSAPNRVKSPEAKALDQDVLDLIAEHRKAVGLPNRGGGAKEDLESLTNATDIANYAAKVRRAADTERTQTLIHAATTGKLPPGFAAQPTVEGGEGEK
jgi:hypothetical protein